MDLKSAKQILSETKNYLTNLPNLNEIISYGQKHRRIQILPYDISYINIYMSDDIDVDNGACALLPNGLKIMYVQMQLLM